MLVEGKVVHTTLELARKFEGEEDPFRRAHCAFPVRTSHDRGFRIEITDEDGDPLLPRELSYPEVLPPRMHRDHLYSDLPDLLARLEALLTRPDSLGKGRNRRRQAMERYSWERMAPRYDDLLSRLASPDGL